MTARLIALAVVCLSLAGCKQPPPACEKMKALCGTKIESCVSTRDSIREQLGDGAVEKFDGCYLGANLCSDATTCLAGAALKATGAAAKAFLDDLANDLSTPNKPQP